jgi:exoribonuclease-2
VVVKDDLLRLDGLPLLSRLPGLPTLPRGQRIEIDILGGDEIELALHARLHQVLGESVAAPDEDELADDALVVDGVATGDAAAAAPPAADDGTSGDDTGASVAVVVPADGSPAAAR